MYSEISLEDIHQEGSVLTLGNFDGIHAGHRALIQRLIQIKNHSHLNSILITYFPNPSIVLGKNKSLKSIYSEESKKEILKQFDFDYLLRIPFTEKFSEMKAIDFLESILIEKLKAKYIIIGFNHFFGKGREGNFEFLQKFSSVYKYQVERIEPVYLNHEQVSSSKIRSLILEGNIELANEFLSQNFFIKGKVVKGFQRGRTIGFPTANLDIQTDSILPKIGVYTVKVHLGANVYNGMMNIGLNPSFNNQTLSIEVHILNFNDSIYGEELTVQIIHRIRDERKFNDINELIQQLKLDKEFTISKLGSV
jgi:riboflavin kinase/FMN adenylyltransferase